VDPPPLATSQNVVVPSKPPPRIVALALEVPRLARLGDMLSRERSSSRARTVTSLEPPCTTLARTSAW